MWRDQMKGWELTFVYKKLTFVYYKYSRLVHMSALCLQGPRIHRTCTHLIQCRRQPCLLILSIGSSSQLPWPTNRVTYHAANQSSLCICECWSLSSGLWSLLRTFFTRPGTVVLFEHVSHLVIARGVQISYAPTNMLSNMWYWICSCSFADGDEPMYHGIHLPLVAARWWPLIENAWKSGLYFSARLVASAVFWSLLDRKSR